jgi:2-methylcitrate dehydratase PrpD
MKSNLTDQFIDLIWNFSNQEFSLETKEELKHTLLDYMSAYLAGIDIGKTNTNNLLAIVAGEGSCSPLFSNVKLSIENTALVNGLIAHYAELDDGHRKGLIHPGAVIFSSLMALNEKYPLDENSFNKAALVGYEATVRLAQSAQPSAKIKGFHGTGLFGTIGAALACTVALGGDKDELKRTLSAACTCASGILRVIKNVSQLKPFNSGNAAKNALSAAFMAKAGYDGPIEVLDGELGFLSMYDEQFKIDALLAHDNQPKIFTIYRKPYAACRHCHPAIDLALDFKTKDAIKAEEVAAVHIATYELGIAGHEHVDIVGVNSAKMSTPYSFAVAMCEGKAGLAEFEQAYFERPDISALTEKVTVQSNDYYNEHYPNKRGAEIKIVTTSGQEFTRATDLPKGEPETKMTHSEIIVKFRELAHFAGLNEQTTKQLIDLCTSESLNMSLLTDEIKKINLVNMDYERK